MFSQPTPMPLDTATSGERAPGTPFLVDNARHTVPISPGTAFIRDTVTLPSWFQFGFQKYGGWKRILYVNSHAVELVAVKAGWRFSYIASAASAWAIGLQSQSVMNRALRRVMEVFVSSGFNSFEITEITSRRILGSYYTRIEAHPRLLWPSPFLRRLNPHRYTNIAQDFEPIFWRAADVEPDIRGI